MQIMKSEKEKTIKCLNNDKSPGIYIYRTNKEGASAILEIYNILSQNLDYNGMAKRMFYSINDVYIDYTCIKERRPRQIINLSHY